MRYRTEESTDYWMVRKVRNGWTPEWGQEGYITVLRKRKPCCGGLHSCGVDLGPLVGDGCAVGPDKSPLQIKVCGVRDALYDGVYPVFLLIISI